MILNESGYLVQDRQMYHGHAGSLPSAHTSRASVRNEPHHRRSRCDPAPPTDACHKQLCPTAYAVGQSLFRTG